MDPDPSLLSLSPLDPPLSAVVLPRPAAPSRSCLRQCPAEAADEIEKRRRTPFRSSRPEQLVRQQTTWLPPTDPPRHALKLLSGLAVSQRWAD